VTLPRHRSSLPQHQSEVCLLKRATQRVLQPLQQPNPVDPQGWTGCACPVLVAWYRGEAETEIQLNRQVDELLQLDLKVAKQQVQHGEGVIRCSCRRVQDNVDRGCDGRTRSHTPGTRCEACEIRYVQSAILLATLDTTCSRAGTLTVDAKQTCERSKFELPLFWFPLTLKNLLQVNVLRLQYAQRQSKKPASESIIADIEQQRTYSQPSAQSRLGCKAQAQIWLTQSICGHANRSELLYSYAGYPGPCPAAERRGCGRKLHGQQCLRVSRLSVERKGNLQSWETIGYVHGLLHTRS